MLERANAAGPTRHSLGGQVRLRLCAMSMVLPSVSFDTLDSAECRRSSAATREGRSCSRMPPVSSLMLDTVIRALRFRRLKLTLTAMWIASGLQAYRSKPLCVALSQVGHFFASADGLCAPGSNRDAVGAM